MTSEALPWRCSSRTCTPNGCNSSVSGSAGRPAGSDAHPALGARKRIAVRDVIHDNGGSGAWGVETACEAKRSRAHAQRGAHLGSTSARGCGSAPALLYPCGDGDVRPSRHTTAACIQTLHGPQAHQISNFTVVSFTDTVCVRNAAPMVDSCRRARRRDAQRLCAHMVGPAARLAARHAPGSQRIGPSRSAARGWTCRRPCRRAAPARGATRVLA